MTSIKSCLIRKLTRQLRFPHIKNLQILEFEFRSLEEFDLYPDLHYNWSLKQCRLFGSHFRNMQIGFPILIHLLDEM